MLLLVIGIGALGHFKVLSEVYPDRFVKKSDGWDTDADFDVTLASIMSDYVEYEEDDRRTFATVMIYKSISEIVVIPRNCHVVVYR